MERALVEIHLQYNEGSSGVHLQHNEVILEMDQTSPSDLEVIFYLLCLLFAPGSGDTPLLEAHRHLKIKKYINSIIFTVFPTTKATS